MGKVNIKTPEQFNLTLLQRVKNGTAQVIAANEYNSLSTDLKSRYYPLFHRADTTYRLKKEFMKARQDPDPNTTPPVIVVQKGVKLGYQFSKNPIKSVPSKSVVTTDPGTTDTDASTKSLGRISKETESLTRNRVAVSTRYSRF